MSPARNKELFMAADCDYVFVGSKIALVMMMILYPPYHTALSNIVAVCVFFVSEKFSIG